MEMSTLESDTTLFLTKRGHSIQNDIKNVGEDSKMRVRLKVARIRSEPLQLMFSLTLWGLIVILKALEK